jgi:hypothetical protein
LEKGRIVLLTATGRSTHPFSCSRIFAPRPFFFFFWHLMRMQRTSPLDVSCSFPRALSRCRADTPPVSTLAAPPTPLGGFPQTPTGTSRCQSPAPTKTGQHLAGRCSESPSAALCQRSSHMTVTNGPQLELCLVPYQLLHRPTSIGRLRMAVKESAASTYFGEWLVSVSAYRRSGRPFRGLDWTYCRTDLGPARLDHLHWDGPGKWSRAGATINLATPSSACSPCLGLSQDFVWVLRLPGCSIYS